MKNNNERQSQEKRIKQYLQELKEIVKKFYIAEMVSDVTKFGSKSWSDIKHVVCSDANYQEESWY